MDKNIKNNRLWLLVIIPLVLLTISQAENINQLVKNYIVYQSLSCEGKDSVWLGKVAEYSILKKDFPTLQLVYISPDKQVSECLAGWQKQLIFSPKVSTETIYSYASVTKIFTSELILDLIRKGKLKLDSKLIDRLSTINLTEIEDKSINDITIGNLLLHQGGFDRKITPDTMVSSSPWCPYRIETLSKTKLDFAPGTKSIYSNLGYCLLSEVIEESYNKKFFSIVEDSFKLNGTSIYSHLTIKVL
jgi:D-alanyl-D-alanine carboxypeptidase